jgi:hypothetical protein
MSVKICWKCGQGLAGGVARCPKCGAEQTSASSPERGVKQQNAAENQTAGVVEQTTVSDSQNNPRYDKVNANVSNFSPKPRSTKPIAVIVVMVTLGLACIAGFAGYRMFFRGPGGQDRVVVVDPKETEPTTPADALPGGGTSVTNSVQGRPTPTPQPEPIKGEVKGNNVRLRRAPSLQAGIVDQFNTGTKLTILECYSSGEEYLWIKVDVDGNIGWMYGQFVTVHFPPGQSFERIPVTADF